VAISPPWATQQLRASIPSKRVLISRNTATSSFPVSGSIVVTTHRARTDSTPMIVSPIWRERPGQLRSASPVTLPMMTFGLRRNSFDVHRAVTRGAPRQAEEAVPRSGGDHAPVRAHVDHPIALEPAVVEAGR
jgi:hypothetical protein